MEDEEGSEKRALQKAQEALRELEKKYFVLAENINEGVLVIQDELVKFVNARAEEMTGYTREELTSISRILETSIHPEDWAAANERWGKKRKTNEAAPLPGILRVYDKRGDMKRVEANRIPFEWEGRPAALVFFKDISEREKAVEALRQSEARYRRIVETANEGIIDLDENFRITYVNRNMTQMLGFQPEELLGRIMDDLELEEDRETTEARRGRRSRGLGESFERRLRCKDGAMKWFQVSASAKMDEEGRFRGTFGMFTDITERKGAVEALKDREQRLNAFLQGSPIPAFVIGRDHRVIIWNKALQELSGIEAQELIGTRGHWRAFYREERPCLADLLVDNNIGQISEWYAGRYTKSDLIEEAYEATDFFPALGEAGRWLRFTGAGIRDSRGDLMGALETLEDLTRRKQAEEALRESAEKYRELVENANSIILRWDRNGRITFFNEFAQKFFGYRQEEILGRNVVGTFVPESDQSGRDLAQMIRDIGLHPERYTNNQNENMRRNGERVWISWTNKPIYDENREVVEILSVGNDLTERKRAETDLIKEKERFQTLTESAPFGMVMIDQDGTFQYVNPRFTEILGYDLTDVPNGKTWFRKAFPDSGDRHKAIAAWLGDLGTSKPRQRRPAIFTVTCKDGSKKVIRFIPVQLGAGENLMTCEDITQRKRTEEELQKLASIIRHSSELVNLATPDGKMVFLNEAGAAMLGIDPEKVGEVHILQVIPERLKEKARTEILPTLREGGNWAGELQYLNLKTGQLTDVYAMVFTVSIPEAGEPLYLANVSLDITERRRAEEGLRKSNEQLRALSARLQTAREEERTRVAREIHDEMGQSLTALKMDISWLARKMPKGPASWLQRAETMAQLVDATIDMVRKISAQLRPGMLDDLGLKAAMEWQLQEFQSRTGIKCKFNSNREEFSLNREYRTAAFRIFQETLTNVARHANTSRVEVGLSDRDGSLILEVRDHGKGITKRKISSPQSLGILGMRERALLLGGEFQVRGIPGKGTTVTVKIPSRRKQGGRKNLKTKGRDHD
jgi:PAS domain S-box-containing protein